MVGTLTQFLVDFFKLPDGFLLVAEHFHDLLPAHHLLNKAIDARNILLLQREVAPRALAELRRCHTHHHCHQNRDKGQRYAQHNHAGKRDTQSYHGVERLRQALPYHLPQRIDVVRIGGHHVAVRPTVEIGNREFLHVGKHIVSQAQHGALRDVDHDAVVGVGAYYAEKQDDSQSEQCLCQRPILRIVCLRERHNIIVYQRPREER